MARTNLPPSNAVSTQMGKTASDEDKKMTLSNLQENPALWYKINVLLYDLCNISKDRAAEARTLRTTDELYISAPYFTPEEAALIKNTVISPSILADISEFEALKLEEYMNVESNEASKEVALQKTLRMKKVSHLASRTSSRKEEQAAMRDLVAHMTWPLFTRLSLELQQTS